MQVITISSPPVIGQIIRSARFCRLYLYLIYDNMKRIYLFCALVLFLFALRVAVSHSFAHACIDFYRLWLGVMLLAWIQHLRPHDIPSRLMFVMYLLLIQPPAITPESMFSMHWIAPAHILFSWTAGCCLWAMLSLPQCDETDVLSKAMLVNQLAAIATGMIWAMDAPDWGMLWQWDSVETGSLCLFIAAYALSRSHSAFWRYLCLILAMYQIWSLYLMPTDQSRHSYVDAQVNALIWYLSAACFLALFICRNRRIPKINHHKTSAIHQTAQYTCGLLMLFIYLLSQGNFIENRWLYPCFAVIWCVCAADRITMRRLAAAAAGVCTMMLPAFVSSDADQIRVGLDPQNSGISLAGIRISDADNCQIYHATIQSDLQTTDISAQSCNHQMMPMDHRDMITPGGIQRFWFMDYQARFGVLLLRRNITLAMLYEIWIVVLWLCFLLSAAGVLHPEQRPHRKLNKPEHNQS